MITICDAIYILILGHPSLPIDIQFHLITVVQKQYNLCVPRRRVGRSALKNSQLNLELQAKIQAMVL